MPVFACLSGMLCCFWHIFLFFVYIQYKETALHLAAREGHLNMVKFLVSRFGERVHETNFFRETCRDIAKERGHRHVVEYLDRDVPTLKSKVSTAV